MMESDTTPGRSLLSRYPHWSRDRSHILFAFGVALSLITAEYAGPVVAIAIGLIVICSGLVTVALREKIIPRIPSVGCWLIAILVIGLASSVLANVTGTAVEDINLERDLGIVGSYIVFLVAGYYFSYNGTTRRLGLLALLAVGIIISIVHLIRFGIVVSGHVSDLYLFRLNSGRGSQTEYAGLFACVLLLNDSAFDKHKGALRGLIFLFATSIFLTLSRNLITDVLVLAIVVGGFVTRPSGIIVPDAYKLIRLAAIAFLSVTFTYCILLWFFPTAFHFIGDAFITKLLDSVTEVSDTNLETRRQIADNYRAFELEHVISTFNSQSNFAQWLGQGWGSTLKFGLETAGSKSHFSRTEAPFLHNGYAFYIMKTGIIGLGLYGLFLCHLAVRAVSPKVWGGDTCTKVQRKILLVCAIVLIIDTLASGGLGFPASYLGVTFLVGICYGPNWGGKINDASASTAEWQPSEP